MITTIIMVIIMVIIFVLCILMYMLMTKKKKRKSKSLKKRLFIKTSTHLKLYNIISRNYLTRKSTKRLYNQISELSIFNSIESRVMCVKVFIISNLISWGTVLISTLLFKDLFIILIMIAYSVVIKEVLVGKQLDKLHYKLYLQLSDALSSLRQMYMQKNSVTEALAEVEAGNLVARPLAEIYSVLTSINISEKLEDFYSSSPLKIIQTLAGICAAIQDTGDTRLENGLSNFVSSLSMISNEVNLEIRRLSLQRSQFGWLELLPILPIFIMAPIKNFFINEVPGTAVIYNGFFGYMSMIVTIFVSIIAFKIITSITRPVPIRYDDREYIDKKLLENRKIKRFVRSLRPINPKKLNKKLMLLKSSISRMNLDFLYLRKFYFSIGVFILILVTIIMSLQLSREFLKTSVQTFNIMGGKKLSAYEIKAMQNIDNMFLKSKGNIDDKDLENELLKSFPNFKSDEIKEQMKRIKEKQIRIGNLKFSYIMFWIALLAAFVAWQIPDLQLKLRGWLIKAESQEDCLQLQTIIGIMMNTQIDTLELLDWLSKHSRVFRPIIIDAYHEYASDPQKALEKLKNKGNIAEFKHLIDKLILTIHQISIAEAFADIMSEREHLLRMREIAQTKSIETKRSAMSPIAVSTTALVVGLYFIAPILMVAITQFSDILKDLA